MTIPAEVLSVWADAAALTGQVYAVPDGVHTGNGWFASDQAREALTDVGFEIAPIPEPVMCCRTRPRPIRSPASCSTPASGASPPKGTPRGGWPFRATSR
jgi:hypothetical protein